MKDLPRVVWMLWWQGWEVAPPLVRACRDSWQRHHPEWEICALTAATLAEHVDLDSAFPAAPGRELALNDLANLARTGLLRDHGGVWADGTLYCAAPLEYWLPAVLTSGFFAFDRPGPGRMLSNWLLAATPQHVVMQAWAQARREHWSGRTTADAYFWHHRLFAAVHERDPMVRAAWDMTPKVCADGPHAFDPYKAGLLEPIDEPRRRMLDTRAAQSIS